MQQVFQIDIGNTIANLWTSRHISNLTKQLRTHVNIDMLTLQHLFHHVFLESQQKRNPNIAIDDYSHFL